MKKTLIVLLAIALMATAASAQLFKLEDSESFNDHNFAIIKWQVNGTAGTPNAAQFATAEEPLTIIVNRNETISLSVRDWGIDSSRNGAKISARNGTDPEPGNAEYLVPLQRYGWGSQISQVQFGNLTVHIGLTHIFRGKTAEWAKFCVVITRSPRK